MVIGYCSKPYFCPSIFFCSFQLLLSANSPSAGGNLVTVSFSFRYILSFTFGHCQGFYSYRLRLAEHSRSNFYSSYSCHFSCFLKLDIEVACYPFHSVMDTLVACTVFRLEEAWRRAFDF